MKYLPLRNVLSRVYSTTRSPSITIVGGGISGLSAAFFLQKAIPQAQITVIEQAQQLGGWVSSKKVLNEKQEHIVFEEGPRSLRPGGLPGLNVLDLIRQLNIEDQMILVPKTSASAKNRYIYFAGKVHKLPSSLLGFLSFALRNPILKGSLSSIMLEPFRRRPKGLEDETIGSFISRRFSPIMANNMLSAVVHGIYSGSVDKLSIKSTFKALWEYETKAGSVVAGLLRGTETRSERDQALQTHLTEANDGLVDRMKDVSVYSFQGGLGTLTNALQKHLASCANVKVIHEQVNKIDKRKDQFEVTLNNGHLLHSNLVISAVKASTLADVLPTPPQELKQIEYSTVMVINLFYKDPKLLPIEGFGYLIPKSVPLEENPDRALGVVFDTSSVPGQDGTPGTKVTCIMGGHFWSGRTISELPSKDAAYKATKNVMAMHLGVTAEPDLWNAKLQKDCIPQYTVGHHARMTSLHKTLKQNFPGLGVLGSSFAGVSVNDCVLNARKLASQIAQTGSSTGLEDFHDPSISGR